IGEKTAISLLQEYHSVENLVEQADQIKAKRPREGLLHHRDDALLSKALVTIKTDVDIDIDWHQFRRAHPRRDELLSLFSELEFNTLFKKVQSGQLLGVNGEAVGGDGQTAVAAPVDDADVVAYDEEVVDYRTVTTKEQLEQLVNSLSGVSRFPFDTESTSADPMRASLVGISFSWDKHQACYVPTPMPDGTSFDELARMVAPMFSSDILKVGQNLKDDILVLKRHGIEVRGPLFDTMVAHYVLSPEEPHGLDLMALKYLRYRMVPVSDLIGTGKNQLTMRDVAVADVCSYACEDADIALQVADVLKDELNREGLLEIVEAIEFPLILVLAEMEATGIRVDPEMLREISRELGDQIAILEKQIFDLAGEEFNIGSTQQLAEILFDKLGLPVISKTPKGVPSTKESVLEELVSE